MNNTIFVIIVRIIMKVAKTVKDIWIKYPTKFISNVLNVKVPILFKNPSEMILESA